MTKQRNGIRRAWRSSIACSTLLVYLLVAVLPFDRVVLCVRPDGQVGLEVAGRSARCIDCGPTEAGSDGDRCCSRSSQGSGEAPCRDVLVLLHEDEPGAVVSRLSVPTFALVARTIEPSEVLTVGVVSRSAEPLLRASLRPPPFQLARVLRV